MKSCLIIIIIYAVSSHQKYDSIHDQYSISPFKLALNDTAHFTNSILLKISNQSNNTKVFTFDYLPTIGVNDKVYGDANENGNDLV
jgi:hypothetical protein